MILPTVRLIRNLALLSTAVLIVSSHGARAQVPEREKQALPCVMLRLFGGDDNASKKCLAGIPGESVPGIPPNGKPCSVVSRERRTPDQYDNYLELIAVRYYTRDGKLTTLLCGRHMSNGHPWTCPPNYEGGGFFPSLDAAFQKYSNCRLDSGR